MEPYGKPEPKVEVPKMKTPSQKAIARKMHERTNRRMANRLKKPEPSPINKVLQRLSEVAKERGLSCENGRVCIPTGRMVGNGRDSYDPLQRLAENMVKRRKPKRGKKEVFK